MPHNILVNKPLPILGIPILNNGRLLKDLIDSINYPIDKIVILNNSYYDLELKNYLDEIKNIFIQNNQNYEIIDFNENKGVSYAWNYLIQNYDCPYYIIANSDMEFGKHDLFKLSLYSEKFLLKPSFISAKSNEMTIFSINKKLIEKVGLFEEDFYPGYYEECDYFHRIKLSSSNYLKIMLNYIHVISGKSLSNNPILKKYTTCILDNNKNIYIAKWGIDFENTEFLLPYNNIDYTIKDIKKYIFEENNINNKIFDKKKLNILFPIMDELNKENINILLEQINLIRDTYNINVLFCCCYPINIFGAVNLDYENNDFLEYNSNKEIKIDIINEFIDNCVSGYIYIVNNSSVNKLSENIQIFINCKNNNENIINLTNNSEDLDVDNYIIHKDYYQYKRFINNLIITEVN